MAALSKIASAWEWCFVPNENDPKHRGWQHPLFSALLMAFTCYVATTKAANYFEKTNPELKNLNLPPYAKKVGKGLVLYLIVMILSRMREDKAKALYDITWACNISIILTIYSLLKNKPVLLAGVLVPISLDLFLWYIDCLSYIVRGKFAVGVAGYLLWPETSWMKRITTSHHLWFLPVIAKILKDAGGITKEAWTISSVLFICLTSLARRLTPKTIINPDGTETYMNVNLSWELWKDIKIQSLKSFDESGGLTRLIAQNCFWDSACILGYFFIKKIVNGSVKSTPLLK